METIAVVRIFSVVLSFIVVTAGFDKPRVRSGGQDAVDPVINQLEIVVYAWITADVKRHDHRFGTDPAGDRADLLFVKIVRRQQYLDLPSAHQSDEVGHVLRGRWDSRLRLDGTRFLQSEQPYKIHPVFVVSDDRRPQ